MLDTHAHYDGPEYADDLDEVIVRAREAGVERVLVPGVNWQDFPHLLAVCNRFPGYLYPMVGLHPEEVNPTKIDITTTLSEMEAWLSIHHNEVVAIGEVGLDYYWDATYREDQIKVFARQVEWALHFQLPLMIHCRKAQQDLVHTLQSFRAVPARRATSDEPSMPHGHSSLFTLHSSLLKGVFHCFTGSAEQARELLSFPGFCLGIGGALTFKKAKLPQVLADNVPLERIVLETDAPYLTPVPHRGQRNESAYLVHVVELLSTIYHLPPETIRQQTTRNALRLFFPGEEAKCEEKMGE